VNVTLLSRLRSAAKTGRGWLRRLIFQKPGFRAHFPSDAELIGALRSDVPGLAHIASVARAGDINCARAVVVTHFRQRTAPRFFVDLVEIQSLAERLAAEHPAWRAKALRSSANWQHYVYLTGERREIGNQWPDWNYLPSGPGCDHIFPDRAHQFAFAVQLARAHAYGAGTIATLTSLLDSWITAVESVTETPAYSSPLIAVHRSIALTWTWALIANSDQCTDHLVSTIFRIILADARFIFSRLGQSPPNNHLLADGFLLWYLGSLFPELLEAERWRHDGEAVFLRELRRQVYEDGTSFEHSVHYHELVCEMVTAYVLLARRNGIIVEPWIKQRLRAMLSFQAALGGPEARAVSIGDAVECHLFPLDDFEGVGAASHREILRALFDQSLPAPDPAAHGQERAAWLLGGCLAPPAENAAEPAFQVFPDGGYVILTDKYLSGCLILRTGPALGAPYSPGHMHADLLSVYLRLNGVPLIVDAGTFSYRSRKEQWPSGEPEWRSYFLGPAAHNGLRIANVDPLDRGTGDFPAGPVQSHVSLRARAVTRDFAWTEAGINGMTAYRNHVRGVAHVCGEYWIVYDFLPAIALTETAWLALQFAPEASVRPEGKGALVAATPGGQLLITSAPTSSGIELLRGELNPLGGWVSLQYGELEPAFACRIRTTGGSACMVTLLQPISEVSNLPTVAVETSATGAVGVQISRHGVCDYLLLSRDAAGHQASFFGIDFWGAALWLRVVNGRPVDLRALGAASAISESLRFSIVSHNGPRNFRLTPGMQPHVLPASEEGKVKVNFL